MPGAMPPVPPPPPPPHVAPAGDALKRARVATRTLATRGIFITRNDSTCGESWRAISWNGEAPGETGHRKNRGRELERSLLRFQGNPETCFTYERGRNAVHLETLARRRLREHLRYRRDPG